MNTLIIPDIHLNHRLAEKFISAAGCDQVIFLGDYFDDFGDTPAMNGETAEWLKDSLTKPNRTHLIGNHDQSYFFGGVYRCSGWEHNKWEVINCILREEDILKLKWYYGREGFLFTHAGLHACFDLGVLKKIDLFNLSWRKRVDNLLMAGWSRGGGFKYGGITWCDFNREFNHKSGLRQIFGHTPQKHGIIVDNGVIKQEIIASGVTPESDISICCDNKMDSVLMIKGGKFEILKRIDL